mgnify:CR=1 FL=1
MRSTHQGCVEGLGCSLHGKMTACPQSPLRKGVVLMRSHIGVALIDITVDHVGIALIGLKMRRVEIV